MIKKYICINSKHARYKNESKHAVTSNLLLLIENDEKSKRKFIQKLSSLPHTDNSYQCYLSRHKEELGWKRRTLDDDVEERSMLDQDMDHWGNKNILLRA